MKPSYRLFALLPLTLLTLSACAYNHVLALPCPKPQAIPAALAEPPPPPLSFSKCLQAILAQGQVARTSPACSAVLQRAPTP